MGEVEFAENERRDVLLVKRGAARFEVEEQVLEEFDRDVLGGAFFGTGAIFARRVVVGLLFEAVGEAGFKLLELEQIREREKKSEYWSALKASEEGAHRSESFPAVVAIAGSAQQSQAAENVDDIIDAATGDVYFSGEQLAYAIVPKGR